MNLEPIPQDDELLAKRVHLAFINSYSVIEAMALCNYINVFDTLDGYRLILIKERDPNVFGFDHPVLHVSVQRQPLCKQEAVWPQTEAGWKALAARLLVRLGLGDLLGNPIQANARGKSVHVWFMVEKWADQVTQERLVKSA